MKNKFNEGDIIIGNEGADVYRAHKEGTILEVVEVIDNKWVYVSEVGNAERIENAATSPLAYSVQSKSFDLLSEDSLLKEARRRYPEGTRVSNSNLGHFCAFTINSTKFHYKTVENKVIYNSSSIGSYTIFENGKWADVIPSDKPVVEDETVVVSKPKFNTGNYVMISPSSIFIDQGYRNGEKLIGKVSKVYGSDPIYYVVVWVDNKKGIYEDKDLEPYLHDDKPRYLTGRDFYSSKFDRIELRELEDPDKYKFIKKTTSLDFQEPVIIKKSTGRKFKLITIN